MSPVVDDNNNNNNVSNDVWLSLFHMFLEKTSGETAIPTAPAPGSSSSSDTLLTPPTPQEAIASNEFAMNAFFNFEDDMTALPGNSLPISQDNFFQSDMQCMNNYLAAPTAHPFTNCLNPAQLLQPMPISALPPLPHLSMPTFGQTPPVTPSPSSSISPSDLLAAASAPTMLSTSSDEAGYRPPSGAMNATARRVGGSWRVPQAFENVPEGPSSVETQPLTHQTSMYWGMARQ